MALESLVKIFLARHKTTLSFLNQVIVVAYSESLSPAYCKMEFRKVTQAYILKDDHYSVLKANSCNNFKDQTNH